MTPGEDNATTKGISRRDAMKASGAAAAGAMALFAAMGSDVAGATSPPWQQADYLNFAKLVTACWKSPSLTKKYHTSPGTVLDTYHIHLPAGTPAPILPAKPAGSLGNATTSSKAWEKGNRTSFSNYSLTVSSTGGTALKFGSFACVACPVSTFSSLSGSK